MLPRESPQTRDASCLSSNLNGTKEKMASGVPYDDESFEEKRASVLACCLRLSIGMWRISPGPIRETRHNRDL